MINELQRSNDPTEKWLRQTLGDSFQPTAPVDAWQRLEPNLPGKKERRPPVFWWLFTVGATIALTVFWFFKKPDSQPEPIDLPQNAQSVVQVLETRASQFFEECTTATASQNHEQQPVESASESKVLQKTAPKTSPPALQVSPENATEGEPSAQNSGHKEYLVVFELPEKPALYRVAAELEPHHAKLLESLTEVVQSLPERQIASLDIAQNPSCKRRFWFGIEAAPTIFFQKNMPSALPGLTFAEMPTRTTLGLQTGVSLAFEPLKNWRIALGLQHSRQSHVAQHTATLRLMDGLCLNPNDPGLKEYEFRYVLVSGGGERSDITLRLQQQDIGSTMPIDESFKMNMETVHRLAAWRVPLCVEYRFGSGRWSGFVQGGTAVNFAEKSNMTVTHFTEICQDLCFQSGHIPTIQASSNPEISVSWFAGAGIERRFSRRAAIRLMPLLIGSKRSLQSGLSVGLLFSN